jgi:thiamine monophosphate synthase
MLFIVNLGYKKRLKNVGVAYNIAAQQMKTIRNDYNSALIVNDLWNLARAMLG